MPSDIFEARGPVRLDEIDDIPSGRVGVYAWYMRPQLGLSERDQGANLRTSIRLGVEGLRARNLRAGIDGRFGLRWEGELIEQVFPELLQELSSGVPSSQVLNRPTEMNEPTQEVEPAYGAAHRTKFRQPDIAGTEDEIVRGALVSGLLVSVPTFAAPLYIGSSDDIGRRLQAHKADFYKYSEYFRSHAAAKVKAPGKCFGERAAAASLSGDSLEAYTLLLDDGFVALHGIERASRAVQALEWVLNISYRPLMGRR